MQGKETVTVTAENLQIPRGGFPQTNEKTG
jgi:hypothetical protein